MKKVQLIIVILLVISVTVISCTKNSIQVMAPAITTFSPMYDTANGTVTIFGTGFTNATAVSFGGTKASSFIVVNATTITAIVGLGSSGNVVVATPGGVATHSGFRYPQIFCNCNASDDIAPGNLIGHWTFDSTTEESISHSNITNSGGSYQYVAGRIGKAISFTNGWLTYPPVATYAGIANSILNSNDTLQNGFTITLWAQLPTNVPADTLLTNLFQLSAYPGTPNWPLAGIAVSKFPDSTLALWGGVTNFDSTGAHPSYDSAYFQYLLVDTPQSHWTFIAMTYDSIGHQLQYFYNGVYVGQSTLFTGIRTSSVFPKSEPFLLPTPNYVTIGAFESNTTFPLAPSSDALPVPLFMNPGLTGVLDDIRFFNITLTPENINDLFVIGTEGR